MKRIALAVALIGASLAPIGFASPANAATSSYCQVFRSLTFTGEAVVADLFRTCDDTPVVVTLTRNGVVVDEEFDTAFFACTGNERGLFTALNLRLWANCS